MEVGRVRAFVASLAVASLVGVAACQSTPPPIQTSPIPIA